MAPLYRPVADHALLVEFGETIRPDIQSQVRRLDLALAAGSVPGFLEAVPAYASVLVEFDPMATDHATVQGEIGRLLDTAPPAPPPGPLREVQVCYDADLAPDLAAVAAATGLSTEQVIAAHLAGDYSVAMYGFAPGYAYLAGVPGPIRLPRKPAALRDIAAGSVIVAGAQCLVTTLTMPTGWWIIGRSPTPILRQDEEHPFLFDVGDRVVFRRIGRHAFDAGGG